MWGSFFAVMGVVFLIEKRKGAISLPPSLRRWQVGRYLAGFVFLLFLEGKATSSFLILCRWGCYFAGCFFSFERGVCVNIFIFLSL